MTNVEQYQKIRKQIEEQFAILKQVGKQAVRDLSTDFFERHPEIESFTWTQYTPYWNDGDICEFGAYTDYPELLYVEDLKEYSEEEARKAEEEISEFLGVFDEEHLKVFFGDHAQVRISREGVEVSDYDHG